MPLSQIGAASLDGAQDGAAAIYGARAWVNFSGNTFEVRASGNVSTVSDIGVGTYNINFATAMVDVNYAVNSISGAVNFNCGSQSGQNTTTYARLTLGYQNGTGSSVPADTGTVHVVVFR